MNRSGVPHPIADAAAALRSAEDDLQNALAPLTAAPPSPTGRPAGDEAALQAVRAQIGHVEHCLACLEDAVGYSVADDLIASERPHC